MNPDFHFQYDLGSFLGVVFVVVVVGALVILALLIALAIYWTD